MTSTWNGRRVTAARAHVLQRDQGICWLCGHPGANSLDHVMPKRDYPQLTWVETNWKAAHLTTAGTPTGCHIPNCQCIGNIGRKTTTPTQPPTRDW